MAVSRSVLVAALAAALSTTAVGCNKKTESAEEKAARISSMIEDANTRLRNNKLKDAEKIYGLVLEEDPEQPDAIGGMGKLRFEQNEFAEAEALLAKAVATKADDAGLWAALGRSRAHQDKHPEAAEAYAKSLELAPENMDVALELGREYKKAKMYDKAEPVLRTVQDEDPRAQYVNTELGDVLREQGKLDEALKLYMKAQNEYQSDKMARAGAALIYEAKGDNKHALDEWSAYIRMDCCSDYSNDVAKVKMSTLKEPGIEEAAAEGDAAEAPEDQAG